MWLRLRLAIADGFPQLTVEMNLGNTELGGHALGGAYLGYSSPLYYAQGSSAIGIKGTLQLSDSAANEQYKLEIEADFPVDGDVITVKGVFKETKPPFIDMDALPGNLPPVKAPAGGESHLEMDAVLKFSKAEGRLQEIDLELELDEWVCPRTAR